MLKFFRIFNNWKTALAYLLINIPGLTGYPMLLAAIKALIEAQTGQNIINFVIQLLMATGVAHRVLKNLNVAKK